MAFSIPVPTLEDAAPFEISIDEGASIVIVGANGSGKTRLAVQIERSNGEQVHRISAHRALNLNPTVPKISESMAIKGLRYGNTSEGVGIGHRSHQRWVGGKEATALLNDFDFLLQALFADQSRVALTTHQQARAGTLRDPKATKFEKLKAIWEQLLPTRQLVLSGDDIQVRSPNGSTPYSAADMSDGERAVFYLIGQTLEAQENSLLVIDEPELHVHRSIMNKLWDHLENARPDCAFVFITHDLEFAASRVGQKFVISDYVPGGPKWRIEVVPEDTGFSEELTTLLLGSRRPVLFVEGGDGSLDRAVYRCAYPEWTVVPMGSCGDVIHAVASMRANAALTRISCAGIVDGDGHDSEEIERLTKLGIAVLPVSEIENLFLLPDISREVALADNCVESEADSRIAVLKQKVLDAARSLDVVKPVIQRYVLRRVDRALKGLDLSGGRTIDEIDAAYRQRTQDVEIPKLARELEAQIATAVANEDVPELLKLIDNKGMLAHAASCLKNTRREAFESWLVRSLLGEKELGLRAALKRALPTVANA
jgi:hypothetical protein